MTQVLSFLDFEHSNPSVFHVTGGFAARLEAAGYVRLKETEAWTLTAGGKYFVTRNGSSLIAFRVPKMDFGGYMIAAAHADAPGFKVKENPELPGSFTVRLSTERYGGLLMATWFDRPLTVAGRVMVRQGEKVVTRLVYVDRDLCIIPSLAIHMNRTANDGVKLQANIDTLPLWGGPDAKGTFLAAVAEAAGVAEADILGHDLFLCLRQKGVVLGVRGEFFAAPRIDGVACPFCCMEGFLAAEDSGSVPVCAVFDNEEVGSGTKQGALSTFLPDTLGRIARACGKDADGYLQAVANSFMVSADNGHAMHPNHPEYADPGNCPQLNGGVVIKFNANQKYTTDAVSAALFKTVCRRAQVPTQVYANRSDLRGGSTLGNLSNSQVSVNTVDVGLAQLAMHAAYETAGARDLDHLTAAMTAFFASELKTEGDGIYLI